MPEKEFSIYLEDSIIVVWFFTKKGEITDFSVALLAEIDDKSQCVAPYDTAHGYAHKDVLGKKMGNLAKEPFLDSDKEKAFHHAVQDFKTHFKDYISFFKKN